MSFREIVFGACDAARLVLKPLFPSLSLLALGACSSGAMTSGAPGLSAGSDGSSSGGTETALSSRRLGGGEDSSVRSDASRDAESSTGGVRGTGGKVIGSGGTSASGGRAGGGAGSGARAAGTAGAGGGARSTSDAAHPRRDSSMDGEPPRRDASAAVDASLDASGPPIPCLPLATSLLTTELQSPVYATAPAGDSRIFVLERLLGRIVIVNGTTLSPTPFLDVSSNMATEGFEVGLLGLAFHPDFAKNGIFYVSYTTLTNTLRVARFKVSAAAPNVADPASESVVIDIPRATHHNTGGMLLFGPDGLLYIGSGDDDSGSNGQDLGVLSGKLLRVSVNPLAAGCTIPSDNPFVGVTGVRPEIWAYGLREPYRFWFDAGALYIADVGDNQREEIDVVAAPSRGGQNFGWPVMEGTLCHTPDTGCDKSGLALPVYEFGHDGGTAVIGGAVYRGQALSACYRGRYFFGSYSAGWVRTFVWDGGVTDARDEPGALDPAFVSFGQDGQGEILLLGYDQTLHRLIAKQ